ncbi:MAG: hypothetical protein ABI197_04700 [Granulicella sp.]
MKGRVSSVASVTLALGLMLLTTGCTITLAPMAKHTAAFSQATAVIVDRSEDAYRSAIELHRKEEIAKAVRAFNNDPSWNPYTALDHPLLTQDQLDARIKVLDALKVYAQSLVALTDTKKQYAPLGTAATAAGTNLQALSTAATPDLQKLFPSATAMTAGDAKGVSTALAGLGALLINNEVHKALPKVTQEMNPNIQTLCTLIDSDVKILRRQADVDYQSLITDENQVILHNQIDPALRRAEIGKMIEMVSQQQANDALLVKLQKAIVTLALTHQALAAAAQGNNPESIKEHVVDLVNAGQELGSYYKSLPSGSSN